MSKRDGGPAFPHQELTQGGTPAEPMYRGMSLRDYFAGQALASVPLRSWDHISDENKPVAWARLAYFVADAMLAEGERAEPDDDGETVLDFDEHRGFHLVHQVDDDDYAQLHDLIGETVQGGCSALSVGFEGCSCPRCALDRLALRARTARRRQERDS